MKRCQRRGCSVLVQAKDNGRPRRYCSPACRQAAYRSRRPRPQKAKHRLAVHFSSQTCEWTTPPDCFAALDARHGPFTLDPCATPENALCSRFFTLADDGLSQPWTGRVFANPPYGRPLGSWIQKAWESVTSGDAEIVVCLVPARTDTAWWHEYALRGEVECLKGRLHFGGAQNGAPFPSVVIVFRNARVSAEPATARYETLPFPKGESA